MPIRSTLLDRVSNSLLKVYNWGLPYKITHGLLAVAVGSKYSSVLRMEGGYDGRFR